MTWLSALAGLARDRRATVAVLFGLAAPVLVGGTLAAVEYASLAARRTKLQLAADDAALTGAQQLRLIASSASGIDGVVRAVVNSVAPTPDGSSTDITSSQPDKRSVRVVVHETVPSLMGRLLTLPTMELQVDATAQISGNSKLCMLILDTKQGQALSFDKDSLLTANGCAVYSNSTDKQGISADKNAQVTAALICSAGGVKNNGAILSPTPTTDCPAMKDPLAGMPRPPSLPCLLAPGMTIKGSQTLYPGAYCGGLTISGNAQVTMSPGIYLFDNGPLVVSGNASLSGTNVGFYFTGDAGGLRFDPNTSINLSAPRDGQMAGLLFYEDRTVSSLVTLPPGPLGLLAPPPAGSPPMRQYRITSNNAPTLIGTIYLPAGRLVIDSNKAVADRSAYTVIVARQLDLNSGPNLYLNSDYGATDIPVPNGVGPLTGNVSLSR